MSKAKKKGKGKSVPDGPSKVTNAEAALYQLDIAAAEKKIERLRKYLLDLDTNNEEIKEKIHSLKWERKDHAAELTKKLDSIDQTLYEHREEMRILTENFDTVRTHSEATISDLEDKYKAMHDQLTSEIKLLKRKFAMISDFREMEEEYEKALRKQQLLYEAKMAEGKRLKELKVGEIQEEKKALMVEFKEKLYEVSSEFTSASAMKSSPYSQRLIRENIAIDKEIELLERSLMRMDQQFGEHMERFERAKKGFPKLNQQKSDLIYLAQKKNEKIAKLTRKFESLRKSYIESLTYKSQFQDMVQHENSKAVNRGPLITQIKKLSSRARMLKAECQFMANKQRHNESEIARLCRFISSIKTTLLEFLGIYGKEEKSDGGGGGGASSCRTQIEYIDGKAAVTSSSSASSEKSEPTLLETLLEMLKDIGAEVGSFDSFENVSIDSFALRCKSFLSHSSDAMRALRESESATEISEEVIRESVIAGRWEVDVVPKERSEHAWILDVEEGSSLYISSGRSTQNAEKEVVVQEFEEEQSSSDEVEVRSASSGAPATQAQAPPPAPVVPPAPPAPSAPVQKQSSIHLLPPGTIVDVVMQEEEEGEEDDFGDQHVDGNAEYDVESVEGEEEMSHFMFY